MALEQARRIAVRAQSLDGTASTVHDTIRRVGFLQIDPISTVATPPQTKREYGYYVFAGDRIAGRIEPRFDRKTRTLEVLGTWGDVPPLDEPLARLAEHLGAEQIVR